MEEINNFQQEPAESLFYAWERFKEPLMKCSQHYLTDMHEVILFYNGLDVPTRQILDSKGAIPSKTVAAAKTTIQEMAEYSQKWHNGTSSRTRTIQNQGASIKTLELQIRQMSKVLQERGFGSLPGSTETNPRDQVKSISTATTDLSEIHRMEHGPYAVSGSQHIFMFPETVPFPRQLHNYCYDGLKEAHGANILDAYDDILP
ncbi:hypothetical protein Tco_0901052 [Tanacetum coccineum]